MKMHRYRFYVTVLCGCFIVATILHSAAPSTTFTRSTVPRSRVRAINNIEPALFVHHHPTFSNFTLPAIPFDNDHVYDFLGMKTKRAVFCNDVYMTQPIAHGLRAHACTRLAYDQRAAQKDPNVTIVYDYPIVGEEYFEYINILDSALDHPLPQRRPYTFVEIGCGYCHWTVSALLAARQLIERTKARPQLRFATYDGGIDQIKSCKDHLQLNNLGGLGTVEHFAIVNTDAPTATFARTGYGWAGEGDLTVPATTVTKILANVSGIVDILDMDIQGGEATAFHGHMQLVNEKVKLVHIGTHGNNTVYTSPGYENGNEIERSLVALFTENGWHTKMLHPRTNSLCTGEHYAMTEYGPVCFADGMVAFINPRLIGA